MILTVLFITAVIAVVVSITDPSLVDTPITGGTLKVTDTAAVLGATTLI